jgi:uncharacterized protein with HEPN domain
VSSRNVQTRIQDILSAIDSIQQRTAGMDFEAFSENETIVKAVLYDLIIIGEAAISIPFEVQNLAPEIPWRLMSDMRNIMAHEYFRVNLRISWSTIQNNLPPLIAPLQQLSAASQLTDPN